MSYLEKSNPLMKTRTGNQSRLTQAWNHWALISSTVLHKGALVRFPVSEGFGDLEP